MPILVVLDDGTYSEIAGTSIICVTDEEMERLAEGDSISDIKPKFEISLADATICGTPQPLGDTE